MAGCRVQDSALGNSPTSLPGMARAPCWPKLSDKRKIAARLLCISAIWKSVTS